MPSLLNPYIPRHSTPLKRSSPQQQPPKLSSAHIDLWEHAALLYHHFEWQSAIETFQHLAGTIPAVDAEANEARTLCALNAAIIQARLGDYVPAAATLEAAARSDVSFIMTPYLLGIMEWELGNLIKAEACLEISLLALRRHRMGEVDFSPYGLEFRLRDEVVREVLKRLRGSDPFSQEEAAQSLNVGFAVFSADCIFEAPLREEGGGRLEEEGDLPVQRRREGQIVSAEGKAGTTRQPGSLIAEKSSSSSKPTPTKTPRETLQELKAFLRGHHHQTPIPLPSPTANPGPPQNLPIPLQSPAALPVATTAPPADATYHSTWRRRPPTPYTPRDARGEYHSVGELARFIRRYRNQSAPMLPRDPRGEGESTGELARFLRSAGPRREGGGGSMVVGGGEVESLLELYLHREDVGGLALGGGGEGVGDGEGGEDCIPRRYSDPISAHPAAVLAPAGIRNRISTDPNTPTTSHFPASSEPNPSNETLTLLLPKVYARTSQPPIDELVTLTPLSLQLLDTPSSSPHRRPSVEGEEATNNPLANVHTAGSETSSLFRHSMVTIERAQVARDEALRRLEGRTRAEGKEALGWDGVTGGDGRVGLGWGGRGEGQEGMWRNGDADADAGGTVGNVVDFPRGVSDGEGSLATTTMTTKTKTKTTMMGREAGRVSFQSKPLPPGPPLGKAGRFEVFLSRDGFLDRREGGGSRVVGGGSGEKDEGEGEGNTVRVPSSKIFEYMSRG